MKRGDSVRVKPGVKDADFGYDLSGWQGRVVEIEDALITVAWDSHTLRHDMPPAMITACEESGLSWDVYMFYPKDLEPAEARDTPADVEDAIDALENEHALDWLGEDGELARQVLADVDPESDYEHMLAWEAYMEAHVTFPFEAEVAEVQERGPLQAGDRVRVHGITDADEWYGIIVRLRKGRKQYHIPLCDLEAIDKDAEAYEIVRQYSIWYTNR
jgi:hypothetical protein